MSTLPGGTWIVDPLWSNVGYEVEHMGVVASRGWFREFSGTVEVSDGGISAKGTVALGSLDTGDWARDEHVKGRLFLSHEEFPELTFATDRFDLLGNGDIALGGSMTLHGVTAPIELRGRVIGVDNGRIGLALTGSISRRDFNLRFDRALPSGTPVVGDEVKLVLDVTAVQSTPAVAVEPPVNHGGLLLQTVSNPSFGQANTYLVGDPETQSALLVDAGGPVAPLLATVAQNGLELRHVLLTHHHLDHVAELEAVVARCPGVHVLVHADERAFVGLATATVTPGVPFVSGSLRVEPILTAGHTLGGMSYLIAGRVLFSGDTLYRDTISTVEMSGHSNFADLRDGIERLLALPEETIVLSGHGEATTIGRELAKNPFVRVIMGLDPEGTEKCVALGRDVTIIVLGTDGHGGERAWIRWPDGTDDVVPGVVLERD